MVKFEQVKLSSLKLPKRTVDRPIVDNIKQSIKELGQRSPVLVNHKRVVIDGLHRVIAMRELKMSTILIQKD